jgi:hypothetical protein
MVDPVWVLVPWWGPSSAPYAPAYDPAAYGITLQCAPATVTVCYDHPSSVWVPGLGTVPLPGHDHLINTAANSRNEWWDVVVVLVLNSSAFPNAAGTTGITSVHALKLAQAAGTASASLHTNFFLKFWVGTGSKTHIQVPTHSALQASEMMPTFYNGKVYSSWYSNGSNATYNSSYGMEPIMQSAQLGVTATQLPGPSSDIEQLYVLVPWWGPSSAPYAPAYNPGAYGIKVQCAPATVGVCFDHPATLQVPGLGTVPLPGHDHLVGTLADHVNIWWHVLVVLVLNQSAWPSIGANGHWTGITSTSDLYADQSAGTVSSSLGTNVFLAFNMGQAI